VQIDVRRAQQQDQAAITAMIRQARLNPAGLQWPQFMVASDDQQIIGVAQVRPYPDGTRELASLAVAPAARGQGVATRLIDALLQTETGAVFTLVDRPFAEHFGRWAFQEIDPADLPRSLARVYRIGRVVTTVASVLQRRKIRIVPLRRPAADVDSPPPV
jgi:N-acetylglutamate synthase-like GNAT family acetyltransferase